MVPFTIIKEGYSLQYSLGEKMAARGLLGGFSFGERLVNGSPAHGPLFS